MIEEINYLLLGVVVILQGWLYITYLRYFERVRPVPLLMWMAFVHSVVAGLWMVCGSLFRMFLLWGAA
jgi:hypothetical protein